MVESFSELNKKCQKPQYKEVGNWMVRKILRPAAIPITWLLLHTPITANQVTFIAILTGLCGNALLASQSAKLFLAAALLLQLWYLLDHVDGQIARYRQTACLSGRFYDFLMHHIIHGTVFFGLGWHVWSVQGHSTWIFVTFVTCFSTILFNLLYDIQYKTFFERITGMPTVHSKEKQYALPISTGPQGIARKAFSLLHKSCEMHVLMNILTAAAILQFFANFSLDLRLVIFVYYSIVTPVLFVTKVAHILKTKKVDQDFDNTFRPSA